MPDSFSPCALLLLNCLRQVRENLGLDLPKDVSLEDRFVDVLDSMAMVEFLTVLGKEVGVSPEDIERAAGKRFGSVGELAEQMKAAGMLPLGNPTSMLESEPEAHVPSARAESQGTAPEMGVGIWLSATAVRLPDFVQGAEFINAQLERPPGWWESHAGISQRRIWGSQDPMAETVTAGRECLQRAERLGKDVAALLVTSEAPPRLVGLAAALHHGLGLRSQTPALEIGGACSGFISALWLASTLVPKVGSVLILSVEAPSRYLQLKPGPAGETAALFGDAAAACLVAGSSTGADAVPVREVLLGADGSGADLVRSRHSAAEGVEVRLDGSPLALRALAVMQEAAEELLRRRSLTVSDLEAVVAHGGNGRLVAMLARQMNLPMEIIWSETSRTGNLGSASLPVAWAAHPPCRGPVLWLAVGAGLTWGAALTGQKNF